MSIFETLRVALRALAANKARSILTGLGVIIGIASVVTLVSVGQSAGASITDRINSLGANLLIIMPGNSSAGFGGGFGGGQGSTLTLSDVAAIQKRASAVAAVIPSANGRVQASFGAINSSVSATGTTPDFTFVRSWPLSSGRFLNQLDVSSQNRVAVLGAATAQTLFPNSNVNPVGQTILLNGVPFQVIGTLTSKGGSGAGGSNADDIVVIPVTTLMYSLFSPQSVSLILFASADKASNMDLATAQIQSVLHFQHGLAPTAADDFTIMNQSSILGTLTSITGTLTFFLGGIAAISLLVGGIGIMNIMLVSVTERTREIGIRRAVGARRMDIMAQFLLEAVTLSLSGGIIGIVLGILFSLLVSKLGHLPSTVSVSSIIEAFVFSALVGIGFGVYPAYRASRQNLVDSLRYE